MDKQITRIKPNGHRHQTERPTQTERPSSTPRRVTHGSETPFVLCLSPYFSAVVYLPSLRLRCGNTFLTTFVVAVIREDNKKKLGRPRQPYSASSIFPMPSGRIFSAHTAQLQFWRDHAAALRSFVPLVSCFCSCLFRTAFFGVLFLDFFDRTWCSNLQVVFRCDVSCDFMPRTATACCAGRKFHFWVRCSARRGPPAAPAGGSIFGCDVCAGRARRSGLLAIYIVSQTHTHSTSPSDTVEMAQRCNVLAYS